MTAVPLFPSDDAPASDGANEAKPTRAKSAKAEKAATVKAGVPRCMEVYDRLFRQKYGADEKPHIRGGKDGKHFKELIGLWGEEEVVKLLNVFFTTTDPRVRSCDYTIGAFYMLAQHLRLRSTRVTAADNRSQRIVDALNRASGRSE